MWKLIVELNRFYNYAVHIPRPQNTENGEPELKKIGEESHYNNELILHNTIENERWHPITDMMQGCVTLF